MTVLARVKHVVHSCLYQGAIHVRRPLLNLCGLPVVNPRWRYWDRFPADLMRSILQRIFSQLPRGGAKVGSLIEHGCGDGSHYGPILRNFCERLIGVDILDTKSVHNLDQYIQVSTDLLPSYFHSVPSGSIDCVLVLSSVGITEKIDWVNYICDPASRTGRYFTPDNYPRILKPGGYFIIVEWEARPEKRFKNADLPYVSQHIKDFYPYPDLPGFVMLTQGYSSECNGPFIVYQKIPASQS